MKYLNIIELLKILFDGIKWIGKQFSDWARHKNRENRDKFSMLMGELDEAIKRDDRDEISRILSDISNLQ